MTKELRFTKYPFVFWSFSFPQEVKINLEEKIINGKNGKYSFKEFNKWAFLTSKYLIPFILFSFLVNLDDLSFSINKALQYVFAIALILVVFTTEDIVRKILISLCFGGSIVFGFITERYDFPGYVLKYFILFILFVLFYVDSKYMAFSLYKNGRVVSNFILNKEDELCKKILDMEAQTKKTLEKTDSDTEKNISSEEAPNKNTQEKGDIDEKN